MTMSESSASSNAFDRSIHDFTVNCRAKRSFKSHCNKTKKSVVGSSRNDVIARKETAYVNRVRAVVLIVLLASTIGVAIAVYRYTLHSEQTQFVNQFEDDALKVLEVTGNTFEGTVANIDTFAANLVSHARATNQSWPFVNIPDFAIRAAKLRSVMLGIGVFLQPFVTPEQRLGWENFAWNYRGWIHDVLEIQRHDPNYFRPSLYETYPERSIYGSEGPIPYNETRLYLPEWQSYPVSSTTSMNWDWLSVSDVSELKALLEKRRAVMSYTYMLPDPNNPVEVTENADWAEWLSGFIRPDEEPNEPAVDLHYPVIDQLSSIQTVDEKANISQYNVVGTVGTVIYWRDVIRNIIHQGRTGIVVVFECPCNPSFTYELDGPRTRYLGRGDKHDPKYDTMVVSSRFFNLKSFSQTVSKYSGVKFFDELCPVTIHIYPSDKMKNTFKTNNPIIYTVAVVAVFAFTSLVFLIYDLKVERRQKLVLSTAMRSNAIVSSLFPSAVRNQMMNEQKPEPSSVALNKSEHSARKFDSSERHSSKGVFLGGSTSKPLAELYPDTTVFFADIAGFTAWSSVRNPHQVFTLLETLYGTFDKIARLRQVFKVETIGDCYVAATGLPDPNPNHAVTMCKFARDCLNEFGKLIVELETTLGPGTADLKMRIGLNSGPTTAGVLRGDKARFQLFGDTVNTAARMESTGSPGRIHVSSKTADLLILSGKRSWVSEREEFITVKGKGQMKTYWIWPQSKRNRLPFPSLVETSNSKVDGLFDDILDDENAVLLRRLVNWNVDIFTGLLKKVISSRKTAVRETCTWSNTPQPLDEFADVIEMPTFDADCVTNGESVQLTPETEHQLSEFISELAFKYQNNAFHNFEHAGHVTMSAVKLLQRIRLSKKVETDQFLSLHDLDDSEKVGFAPLTQLAIVFAAIIHDVDHHGMSNFDIMQQNLPISRKYGGKSIAEQNSIDVSWNLLMQPRYEDLQKVMFTNDMELRHFRQVVVNSVITTDVFDMDLKSRRDLRWESAFGEALSDDAVDRQATAVIEHVMLASEVAHTMQHWEVYQSWNRRLFQEMHAAYRLGRSDHDPSKGWYEGELRFFDEYIIPLAQKLKASGAFGVSCDEFLDYALDNRLEWEIKGREISERLQIQYENGDACANVSL